MNDFVTRLKEKGWSDEDIYRALSIINKSEENKPSVIRKIDSFAYWMAILVAIVGNLIISIILIPFLILLKSTPLYFIVVVIALTFGFLFKILAMDIEKISENRIILSLFIPLTAIISMFYMTRFANYLITSFGISNIRHNPLIVAFVYVIAFVIPLMIRTKRS